MVKYFSRSRKWLRSLQCSTPSMSFPCEPTRNRTQRQGANCVSSLTTERLRFKLPVWRRRIQAESVRLWGSEDTQEMLQYYGQNPSSVREEWRHITIEWVRELLTQGASERRLKRQYRKSFQELYYVIKRLKEKKRANDFDLELKKHSPLLVSPTLCPTQLAAVASGKEGDSVVFQTLRERPDLI